MPRRFATSNAAVKCYTHKKLGPWYKRLREWLSRCRRRSGSTDSSSLFVSATSSKINRSENLVIFWLCSAGLVLGPCRPTYFTFYRDEADLIRKSTLHVFSLKYWDYVVRPWTMASSEVDNKFLGNFAANISGDHPFLSSQLFQILGNLEMLSPYVIQARKQRRLDTTRNTASTKLYCKIIWYARGGLQILEEYVLPMVTKYTELKALAYKLRASYYHLYVLFHNSPPISLKSPQIHTPPGLKSPRSKLDKGKGIDRGSPDPYRPSSVQPTHPLEGGPVGGLATSPAPLEYVPDFLIPAQDYRPIAHAYFVEAATIADKNLWGSHPLRLSIKVEMCAFLYDCLHERDKSRSLAKVTIAEVYNAQEGMDDDMFEDAAELVGILGRMMKRGLGTGGSGSTPGGGSEGSRSRRVEEAVAMPGMMNPI